MAIEYVLDIKLLNKEVIQLHT